MRWRANQWIGLGLLILLACVSTWATWRYVTKPIPGGNDFLTHYGAWEAYLKYGYSPYSEEAALHTQRLIYGRPALIGEDQNRMVYPFYSILLHGPFVYVDYALSRAIYMTLLAAALLAGVIMTVKLVNWNPPAWTLAFVLVWAVIYYPEARGIMLGQFAIFGFFSLAGSLYFLKNKQDWMAGALLVVSTIKPTLVFLVVPFLMLWAIFQRRWNFLIGFIVTLGILILGSLLLSPGWIGEWLFRMTRYSEYTVGQSPVWLLTHSAFPWLGEAAELLISLVLLVFMLLFWWQAIRSGDESRFNWASGFTLVVSSLVVPRSATTNYVLMLIPTIWIFAALERSGRWGRLMLPLVLFSSIAGLWWLHYATVVGNQEQPIMFIPSPVILLCVLAFGRRWLMSEKSLNSVAPGHMDSLTSGA